MAGADEKAKQDVATLGGGCFWCLEPIFRELEGVLGVTVGYAGGRRANPTYEQVGTGATGHAEVVQVIFDAVISLRQLPFPTPLKGRTGLRPASLWHKLLAGGVP